MMYVPFARTYHIDFARKYHIRSGESVLCIYTIVLNLFAFAAASRIR